MKQLGKIQEKLNKLSASPRLGSRDREMDVVDLAELLFSESQSVSDVKSKRIRLMLSLISQNESVRSFFQLYHENLTSSDTQVKQRVQELYAQHRQEILQAFCFTDAWKLRLARYCFMDELALIESLIGDSLSCYVMPDQASSHRKQQDKAEKIDACRSIHILTPPSYGDDSANAYVAQMLQLLVQVEPQASIDIDVMRLLPRMDSYQPELAQELFLQRVRPLIDANALRAISQRMVFSHIDEERLALVGRACRVLREEERYNKVEFVIELASCMDSSPDVVADIVNWSKLASDRHLTLRLMSGDSCAQLSEQTMSTLHGVRVWSQPQERTQRLIDLIDQISLATQLQLDLSSQEYADIAYACVQWKSSGRDGLPAFTLASGLSQGLASVLISLGARVYLHAYYDAVDAHEEAAARRAALLEQVYEPHSSFSLSPSSRLGDQAWRDMIQQFHLTWSKRIQLRDMQAVERPASYLLPIQSAKIRHLLESACSVERAVQRASYKAKIGTQELESQFSISSRDPRDQRTIDYKVESMNYEQIDALVEHAKACSHVSESLPDRLNIWKEFTQILDRKRCALIAVLVRDAGYRLADADAELAEARAMCEALIEEMGQDYWSDGVGMQVGGIAVVNTGMKQALFEAVEGIASAHLLGYTVIYKPANNALRMAEVLLELLQESGLRCQGSKVDLCLAQCMDNQIAEYLFNHRDVAALFCYAPLSILGEKHQCTDTPYLHRRDEKNHALYLRADAEWKQALVDLADAQLYRSGQTCSSPRILLVDKELYDQVSFHQTMKDVFSSIQNADLSPSASLLSPEEWSEQLNLSEGESWLLAPDHAEPESALYRPAVRLGVSEDSALLCADKQLSYPQVLVISVDSSEQAIRIQSRVTQGDAASLYTCDVEFIKEWKSQLQVPKLFINASPLEGFITTREQGGAATYLNCRYIGDYLPSLARWEAVGNPARRASSATLPFKPWELIGSQLTNAEKMRLHSVCDSIYYWWSTRYGVRSEKISLTGAIMQRVYHARPVLLRIPSSLSESDAAILLAAALTSEVRLELSLESSRPWMEEYLRYEDVKLRVEDDFQFQSRFKRIADRMPLIRYPEAGEVVRELAEKWLIPLRDKPVVAHGRVELMYLHAEQWVLKREQVLTGF